VKEAVKKEVETEKIKKLYFGSDVVRLSQASK
jgi:hypothetical protein